MLFSNQMKNILLDTSFLIECVRNKIDINKELSRILDENFQIAILDRTHDELESIRARGGKDAAVVKLANTILIAKKFIVYPTSGKRHTDTLLLEKAGADTIIATMDKELKRRLKQKKQDVMIVRGNKKLDLIIA